MKVINLFRFLTVLMVVQNIITYKILGVFYAPSHSHYILGSTLLKALADKGHEVTMISPFPCMQDYPNYIHMELTGVTNVTEEHKIRNMLTKSKHSSLFSQMAMINRHIDRLNEFLLNHHVIKDLISSKQKFDVVIQEYIGNDAVLGLSHYFDAYSIVFSPIRSNEALNHLTKNPAPSSYIPSIISEFSEKMNFWQRVANFLAGISCYIYISLVATQKQQGFLNKYLPKTILLENVRHNISLVLLNSHFAIEGSRPYLPNMVQIGGFHIQAPKSLPAELKDFLDSATNGAILFSLGSIYKSTELLTDKLQQILNTFAALPQKVLWKFEDENITNIPNNVKILKWLPQTDILAHPNLRVFITHGGQLSITETIYHGVPIVGIPFGSDQMANVNEAVFQGYGVKLEANKITYDTLSWALREVLNNPRYQDKATELSAIFKDRPKSALSEAIYWIEYVIKHKGAHHLKSVAMKLKWYQLYSLDVLAFYLCVFLLFVSLLYYLIYKLPLLLIAKMSQKLAKNQTKLKQK